MLQFFHQPNFYSNFFLHKVQVGTAQFSIGKKSFEYINKSHLIVRVTTMFSVAIHDQPGAT